MVHKNVTPQNILQGAKLKETKLADVPVGSLAAATGEPVVDRHRSVRFERGRPPVDTPVYRRPLLAAGHRFAGPAIVEERETTAVIRPGWSAEVLADGSIVATRTVTDTEVAR